MTSAREQLELLFFPRTRFRGGTTEKKSTQDSDNQQCRLLNASTGGIALCPYQLRRRDIRILNPRRRQGYDFYQPDTDAKYFYQETSAHAKDVVVISLPVKRGIVCCSYKTKSSTMVMAEKHDMIVVGAGKMPLHLSRLLLASSCAGY